MPIRDFNILKSTVIDFVGTSGPVIVVPPGVADSVAESQVPVLGTPINLNGAATVPYNGSATACVLPFPMPLVISTAAAATTFTVSIDGINQSGIRVQRNYSKSQTASATQRDTTGLSWSIIYSITFSALSAGAITIGFLLPEVADVSANGLARLPLPFTVKKSAHILGVFIEDDGGATVTTGESGTMLKAGVGSFNVLNQNGGTTDVNYFGFGPVAGAQPTRSSRYRVIFAPGFAAMYQ